MFSKKSVFKEKEDNSFLSKLVIVFLFLVLLFFLYKIINIVVILLFSIFLNILFSPFLDKFNKYKIKDWLGIIIIYAIILFFIFIFFFSIFPIFIKQTSLLIQNISDFVNLKYSLYQSKGVEGLNLPHFLDGIISNLDLNQIFGSLKTNISGISVFVGNNLKNFLTNGAGFIFSITDFLTNLVLIFVFTLFIALERKEIKKFSYKILPKKISKEIHKKEDKIISTLYSWLKGQLLLCLSIFLATFLGLLFLRIFGIKIDEFFTLAVIAGFMEFIPIIGFLIALLPALAIALGLGYEAVIGVLILYFIIQQLENNVLVPYIMGKSLSISPFAVLITMTIGGTLFGIVGIIIAIPVASVIKIFLSGYLDKKN